MRFSKLCWGVAVMYGPAAAAEAKVYTAVFTGTVGTDYFTNGDLRHRQGVFGGGDLTGMPFSASFTADFDPSTPVTDTGNAIAVLGTPPDLITGRLTINGHAKEFGSFAIDLFGLAYEDSTYGNGVSAEAVANAFVGLDIEVENFDPLRPILSGRYFTSAPYTIDPADDSFGLFGIPGPNVVESGYLIPSTVRVTAAPEPGAWALMTIGFGMDGAAARRRARSLHMRA